MKYDTIETINLLKSLVAEKSAHLDAIMKDVDRLQGRLHRCRTMKSIDKLEKEKEELIAEANEEIKYINKARRRIAKFYEPATKVC